MLTIMKEIECDNCGDRICLAKDENQKWVRVERVEKPRRWNSDRKPQQSTNDYYWEQHECVENPYPSDDFD